MHNPTRPSLDLSGIWNLRFEECPEAGNFAVAVPASFNDQFTEDWQRNCLGAVHYEREIWVPESFRNRRVILDFEGVNYRATVHWNGETLGTWTSSHLPFAVEVTELVNWDEPNLLQVTTDVQLDETTVPQGNLGNKTQESGQIVGQYPDNSFDFFPYGGIHRPVRLISLPVEGHIEDVWVETLALKNEAAEIRVKGHIHADPEASMLLEIPDYGISMRTSAGACAKGIRLTVNNPRPWSPKDPALSSLHLRLFSEDQLIDHLPARFGIRTIEVRGTQLLLNGERIFLKGFGKHEDTPVAGRGLQPAWNVRDFNLMKWTGANSFRKAHYPYSESILDLADEQGFLVISETPAVSLNFKFANETTLEKSSLGRHS